MRRQIKKISASLCILLQQVIPEAGNEDLDLNVRVSKLIGPSLPDYGNYIDNFLKLRIKYMA